MYNDGGGNSSLDNTRKEEMKSNMKDKKDLGRARARQVKVTPEQFRALLAGKMIRGASLDDVLGTHHQRPLYMHPTTGEWYVAVKPFQSERTVTISLTENQLGTIIEVLNNPKFAPVQPLVYSTLLDDLKALQSKVFK